MLPLICFFPFFPQLKNSLLPSFHLTHSPELALPYSIFGAELNFKIHLPTDYSFHSFLIPLFIHDPSPACPLLLFLLPFSLVSMWQTTLFLPPSLIFILSASLWSRKGHILPLSNIPREFQWEGEPEDVQSIKIWWKEGATKETNQ